MATPHQSLGVAVVVTAAAGLLWSVALAALRRPASPSLRAYARLLLLVVSLEGVIGLLLLATGHRPGHGGLHVVYAAALGLFLGLAIASSRAGEERRELGALMLGLLAAVLLGVRAVMTGG